MGCRRAKSRGMLDCRGQIQGENGLLEGQFKGDDRLQESQFKEG